MKKREGEFYELFDVEFRRVTSILGRLKRWGLDEWQAKCAVEFMMSELVLPLAKGWMTLDQLKETNFERVQKAAMAESEKRKNRAADKGRAVHKAIHEYYRSLRDREVLRRIVDIDKDIEPAVLAFLKWEGDYLIEMIGTEKQVFSMEHGYAGTLDLEAKLTEGHYVVDFKTGNPDPATVMQLAAYVKANESMTRIEMDGGGIVYLNSETGMPRWKGYERSELELPLKMFLILNDYCALEDQWKKKEPFEGGSPADLNNTSFRAAPMAPLFPPADDPPDF